MIAGFKRASMAASIAGLLSVTGLMWQADSLERLVLERVERGGSTGLAVAEVTLGGVRFAQAGKRRGEESERIDSISVFEIGSVSKVLTTTLLAEMVGRGEVALEDPVERYLPASVRMPEYNGRKITLLDLATATSGLPRIPDLEPPDPANPYAHFGAKELYAWLSGYTLTREPGLTYEYSNLGMGLLGHALALKAGKPYQQLVRERMLQPLGMTETRIVLTEDLRARLVSGHGSDLQPAANWDFDALAGAGGWRSTARDMARLVTAMLHPPAGTLGAAIALTVKPRRETGRPNLRIGLGWHILQRGSRRILWHNGETAGYYSWVGFDVEAGRGAVVLSGSALEIDDIGLHLVDSTIPLHQLPSARQPVAVEVSQLDRYVGRYELAPGFVLEVTRNRDQLLCQATGQGRLKLIALSPTRFAVQAVEAELEFKVDGSEVTLFQGGRQTPGKRLP